MMLLTPLAPGEDGVNKIPCVKRYSLRQTCVVVGKSNLRLKVRRRQQGQNILSC